MNALRSSLAAIAAVVALASVAAAQSPPPPPAPTPSATPTATPTPPPATAPTQQPTPLYRYIYRPTPSPVTTPFPGPNAPRILEVDLSDSAMTPPATIAGRVLTSANTVGVVAETMGETLTIPKQAPGVFAFVANVTAVPFFLRNKTYDVAIVATAPDGETATVTLPLAIR